MKKAFLPGRQAALLPSRRVALILSLLTAIGFASCKKDSQNQPPQPFTNGLQSLSVNGQLISTPIGSSTSITILVGDSTALNSLLTNFTLATGAQATVNNNPITNGSTIDYTLPVNFIVTSGDKKSSSSYTITVQKRSNYFGLTGSTTSGKSLDRNYNFYYDQFDGSPLQGINCGPAVSTMAIKWADSTFTKTPLAARTAIYENGGDWTTNDIAAYLNADGISNVTYLITSFDSLVKAGIDHNNAIILCLNMFYNIDYNGLGYQHTQKFYQTLTSDWGHFLLVKGYKQTSDGLWLEIYDPYSNGNTYTDFLNQELNGYQLKGKDRYYASAEIEQSCRKWWSYVIMVAPKGQTATMAVQNFQPVKKLSDIPVGRGR